MGTKVINYKNYIMNKICTTIEQSQKLIELGIDENTADMYYGYDYNSPIGGYEEDAQIIPQSEFNEHFVLFPEDIPAWSLEALLELMPKNESLTIDLCLGGSNGIDHTFDWFCTCDENDEPYNYKTFHTSSPIDCTFEMICWLKENDKL